MKCWKCGKENIEGSSSCIYCSSSLIRPEPVTETGRAMRQLYDHYGAEEVLSNSAYLVNGLGDLLEDSKKLRNQLKMAADAGVFRLYLEQLAIGHPDPDFDQHARILLTEDAGLSDKAVNELTGYFDEMIGWRFIRKEAEESKPGNDSGTSGHSQSDNADAEDVFKNFFSNAYSVPGTGDGYSRSVLEILKEYLPQLSSPAAKNSRYEIRPAPDSEYLNYISKKWLGWAMKTGEKILDEIHGSGQTVLAVFNSGYSNLKYPLGIRFIFTEKSLYTCGPGNMTPWYTKTVGTKEKQLRSYKCDYNVLGRVEARDHNVLKISRRITCTLRNNTQNYGKFEFFFEKKYFNEDKLVEMFRLLSNAT